MLAPHVTAVILHPEPGAAASPLERAVGEARARLAERQRSGFLAAGAAVARVVTGPPDDTPFGRRLRDLVAGSGSGGIVVLGSGAIPLATRADRRALVEAAAASTPGALANSRYSADVIAISRAATVLHDVPDLATDNALPRWLEEIAGIPVSDLGRRWHLAIDVDGPLELVLLGGPWTEAVPLSDRVRLEAQLTSLRGVVRNRVAELLVAGRTSSTSLRWLERHTELRTRALVEERGMRTLADGQRKPASVIGMLLDRDGPSSLGTLLPMLGDAAMLDTRVLLAHRLGANERRWPSRDDRFASDLLLHERIKDPWLRALTASAVASPIPVLLGGHSLVGPGVRLVVGRGRRGSDRWT